MKQHNRCTAYIVLELTVKTGADQRQQSLKRKSEDFIYELSENDLSADESVEDMLTKMRKIDSDAEVEVPNQIESIKNLLQ
ncbi:hypothetical protein WA026_014156 [Henosepilachna vigintioctopunctata]|uniref:Uncharacterized protein n=1 Tax=Henosepilachna vigintioctopunctata TaxID=420089 RepID=A0AAW1TTL2_9CUCU